MPFSDYARQDATGLAELVRRREVSAQELLDTAIDAVERLDPELNAVVIRDYGAARRQVAAGLSADGVFSGVPLPLKDLFSFYEGTPVTNGAWITKHWVADHSSTYVKRCLAAGLVPFCKTNSPEFGVTVSTEPVLHGPTRNPWNTAYSVGGSSGGAAAAVASGMVPMAHATDGGGSIRIPAASCGLVGLKPSRGRVPVGPMVGEAWNGLATGHVITRTVRDTAAMLDATAGLESGDPYSAPAPPAPFRDALDAPDRRLKIALMTTPVSGLDIDPELTRATEAAARLCESLGHAVELAQPSRIDGLAMQQAGAFCAGINCLEMLDLIGRERGAPIAQEEVEPSTWDLAQAVRGASALDYLNAIQRLHLTGRAFGRFLDEGGFDVVLSPTLGALVPRLGHLDTHAPEHAERVLRHIAFTQLYNIIGAPAISLPLAWDTDGLPLGVQFGAAYGDDWVLLQLAAQLERAAPWADRLPPLHISRETEAMA